MITKKQRILSKHHKFSLYAAYPDAVFPERVGTYPIYVKSGGGYFYDDVLKYRVWVHPPGEDVYFVAFSSYEQANEFSKSNKYTEPPLVLVYQEEYIDEQDEGKFKHIKESRIAEWKVDWLEGAQGTKDKIPEFLSRRSKLAK